MVNVVEDGNNISNLNSDIFIGYLYAREKKSRIYRSEDIDCFELLEANVVKYQNLGKVFICRDLNARAGCEPGYIVFDHCIEAGLKINIESADISYRKNKDHVIDFYGKRLIELCKITNLLIANLRLGSDKGIGEFTFYGQKRQAKALIRLRVCAGWSEPLLVAHTTLLEITCRGSSVVVTSRL